MKSCDGWEKESVSYSSTDIAIITISLDSGSIELNALRILHCSTASQICSFGIEENGEQATRRRMGRSKYALRIQCSGESESWERGHDPRRSNKKRGRGQYSMTLGRKGGLGSSLFQLGRYPRCYRGTVCIYEDISKLQLAL